MISINWNKEDGFTQLNVEGTKNDYHEFIDELNRENIKIPLEIIPNNYYPHKVRNIKVEILAKSYSAFTFHFEEENLLIKAGKSQLLMLIKNIKNLTQAARGSHFHLDHFGFEDLISQEEIILILNLN